MKLIRLLKSVSVPVFFCVSIAPALADPVQNTDSQRIRDLAADWWQWTFHIPLAVHPLVFDEPASAAAHCGIGQHGDVWFLGGAFNGNPARRECVIPAGKLIFFPVVNMECSVVEGDGITEEELRSCAELNVDKVTLAEARIDGYELQPIRISSDVFTFKLPPGDLIDHYGKSPNPSPSVAGGYWVLLDPLDIGEYRIELNAILDLPGTLDFEVDVIYDITVVEAMLD